MRFVRGLSDPPANLDLAGLREAVAVDEVRLAVLFGSYAAGTAGSLSDLDVGLWFRDGTSRSRRIELLDELTVAIVDATAIEAVDLVDLEAVGPRIGYEALATGTLIHGDPTVAEAIETTLLVRKLDFQPVKRAWDRALDGRIRNGTYGRP